MRAECGLQNRPAGFKFGTVRQHIGDPHNVRHAGTRFAQGPLDRVQSRLALGDDTVALPHGSGHMNKTTCDHRAAIPDLCLEFAAQKIRCMLFSVT